MTQFTDEAAKAVCQAECDKRNKSISKFHPMRWKTLFDSGLHEWKPTLRPAIEREYVKSRRVSARKVGQ